MFRFCIQTCLLLAIATVALCSKATSTSGQHKSICEIKPEHFSTLQQAGIVIQSKQKLIAWQKQNCPPKKTAAKTTKYELEFAADLKNGNYKHNVYKLKVKRQQQFSAQSRWDFGVDYQTTELEQQSLVVNDEKISAFSNITYQPLTLKKIIGFVDVSFNSDDRSGLVNETNAIVGAGYAFWGNDYHAKCNLAKYSLGTGLQQREVVNLESENESILSHKLSMSVGITEQVCLKAKHIYRRILGDSGADKINNSVTLDIPVNRQLSVFAKYLYINDKGAATGFRPRDEQIEFGAKVKF